MARPGSDIEHRLIRRIGDTIREFSLIEDGDRVLVAMSGGKDSYALLVLLDLLRKRAPVDFTLLPWHLDQGQPGYDGAPLRDWLVARGYHDAVIASEDTYSVVKEHIPDGKTYCSLCSRLRRGILYDAAVALRCNKIALGHHADDSIETAMLNLLFAGQLKAMPAWLRSDDGRNVVIRPLIRCWERDLAAYAKEQAFPILPCNLCGSQDNLQRAAVKAMLAEWEAKHPRTKESMVAALGNVRPSHLLDRGLWKRLGMGPEPPEHIEPVPLGRARLAIAE